MAKIPEASEQRDRKELLELASMYLSYSRCCGGHLVHSGYVCPRCDSNNPSTYCCQEKVHRKDEHVNELPKVKGGWTKLEY